jgi:hypothetical protein
MAIIGIVNAYVGSSAILLRAEKREPMLIISAWIAVGYFFSMLFLRNSSLLSLFMAFSLVQLCLALPFTALAVKKSDVYRQYHMKFRIE